LKSEKNVKYVFSNTGIDYTVVCFMVHDCRRKLRKQQPTSASWVWFNIERKSCLHRWFDRTAPCSVADGRQVAAAAVTRRAAYIEVIVVGSTPFHGGPPGGQSTDGQTDSREMDNVCRRAGPAARDVVARGPFG